MDSILLAVNGTLMRELELNDNLTRVGAKFIREDQTDACYRLWSIEDKHPAMIRNEENGVKIELEIWDVPRSGLISVLLNEPPGLTIGKVILQDKNIVLGVLGEPFLCINQLEITEFGGWRSYIDHKNKSK